MPARETCPGDLHVLCSCDTGFFFVCFQCSVSQKSSQLRFSDPLLKENPEQELFIEPSWLVQLRKLDGKIKVSVSPEILAESSKIKYLCFHPSPPLHISLSLPLHIYMACAQARVLRCTCLQVRVKAVCLDDYHLRARLSLLSIVSRPQTFEIHINWWLVCGKLEMILEPTPLSLVFSPQEGSVAYSPEDVLHPQQYPCSTPNSELENVGQSEGTETGLEVNLGNDNLLLAPLLPLQSVQLMPSGEEIFLPLYTRKEGGNKHL